ncbi:MAG: tetratricopeptide repeat protein [Treponema sp.]|jgi:predicted Zn-dependent protease|nr:tetratricopeptide repeat protein [Treponema sp.]
MPSLQQLDEFSTSFKDIGNESIILANRQDAGEILPLPEKEPSAPFPEAMGAGEPDTGSSVPNFEDLGIPSFDSPSGLAFGDLVESSPPPLDEFDDLGSLEDLDESAGPDESMVPPDSGAESLDEIPPDLLSGFADTLESGGLPAGESSSAEPAVPAETENIDLARLPTLDLDNAFDMGGEARESAKAPPEPVEDLDPDSFNFSGDGLPAFVPGAETSGGDLGGGADAGGFDLGGAGGFADAGDLGGESLDGFGADTSTNDTDLGDFGTGDLDLGGFADTSADDLGLGDLGADAAGDLGGENLDGFDTGASTNDLGDTDLGDFGTGDLGGFADTSADDLGLGDLGADAAGDLGGENLDGFDSGASTGDLGDLGGENLDGFDTGASTNDLGDADFSNFGADTADAAGATGDPGDLGGFGDAAGGDSGFPDTPADSFDTFSLGGETPGFPPPGADAGGDNFSLDGFDDTFNADTVSAAVDADIEEIRLSESDFKKLQNTLSEYPLNLRLACEELIAEKAVSPDLMSALVRLLVRGAPAKETAGLAGKILGRGIPIPKGYSKQTGEELEEEQSSFSYVFVHSFLPVLRLFGAIALVVVSLIYLGWTFIYTPLRAERVYREGYTQLENGQYIQSNDLFRRAFEIHHVKKWFYRYAEGFRDRRQFIHAERKYDELLRAYPRDKKGALDYASMETNYLRNYEKADRIIRNNILDWGDDREGLLALAENNLAWGETDNSRYEEARSAYARLMEKYGRQDPYLEGMLKYFIRTDKLAEVLPLQAYFMNRGKKRKITVPTLAELAEYLLYKKFQAETMAEQGINIVPDEYTDSIDGIRDILLRAIKEDAAYPESYYHLARYYERFGSKEEERGTLERAAAVFAAAPEENSKRAAAHVDTLRMYADVLIKAREFFNAEEQLILGVRLYEDARSRQVLKTNRQFGRLYASLGDLSFYTQEGDMSAALRFYEEAERNGWSSNEMQYRMGAAHYQNEEWEEALNRFFTLVSAAPNNRRLLYALGNTAYLRGDYFAAQDYYNRLMDQLETDHIRMPDIAPGAGPGELDLAERIMVAENNLGVVLETLTRISGDSKYRSRSLGLFAQSVRAWDVLTRNPDTMSRLRPIKELYGPGVNLAFLNAQNVLHPEPNYQQQIFMRIDRDMVEPSDWEELTGNYELSGNP